MSRRIGVVVGRTLVYALIWAGLVMLIAAVGIRFYWGTISVGQLLLNLTSVELDGGGGAIVWLGILGVGVAPLLITAGIAVWRFLRRRSRRRADAGPRPRRERWLMRALSGAVVTAIVVGGTAAFASTVSVGKYLQAASSDYDLGDYYVEPVITGDENKRNLVLIYLESGEATLEDDQLFEKDAFTPLKDVTEAADGWQSIDGFQQYDGGGWTMSGLTSTQCGVPLRPALGFVEGSSEKPSDDVETYLAGTTCLGDVLADHGYTNVFLGGANLRFAAKDVFLRTHDYSEISGLADWRVAGDPESSFRSDWGLSDERLMAHAMDTVDELHAESERTGEPFNLSLLTLDTHEPVHVYDYCDVDTQNPVTSVFSCSMTQVAGFVDHLESRGYLEDTAVVIMGDHLKHLGMAETFHEQLDDHPDRTIFNRFWIPGSASAMRPRIDQLNLYPTILEAAGLEVEDSAAGLGVSAFTDRIPKDSAQALDPDTYSALLESRSRQFYAQAWADDDGAPQ
ncbi:sulfatase-like hydrolase/transferase [Arthrobacter echini]|uniref:sulfatase-like hydrolase/transferase n=1 Tax=Arthrobacter echini TaxID=1529066 RepID=UPI001FE3828B|nr:sulfatase-like hydrolase/transferase [Arthrobacter echini]